MNLPFASIIVPVYNGENTISECIESLLSQDYPKDGYEIIIVDNNSTDHTAEVIRRYPVKYILEDRIQSSYAARNTGAMDAKGEALVFFDADQIATKNWLRNLLQEWDRKEYGAFGSREINSIPDSPLMEKYLQPSSNGTDEEGLVKLATSCAAYRRYAFEALNGFDINFAAGGDYDLGFRLQKYLGLMIKFSSNSLFYHRQQRANLLSVLKRESRSGFGRCMLGAKHAEFEKTLWLHTVEPAKRTAVGLIAFLYGILKPLHGSSRREHLLTILLDITARWAYYYGVLKYYWGADRCGDLPSGTKTGRRHRFDHENNIEANERGGLPQ